MADRSRVPAALDLKRIWAVHSSKFWRNEKMAGFGAAPVYLFPDQDAFDSDDIDVLIRSIDRLTLPHDEVIFEVRDRDQVQALAFIAFVRGCSEGIEAFLVQHYPGNRWSDVLGHAVFQETANLVEVDTNPRTQVAPENANRIAHVLRGMVLRALAILQFQPRIDDHALSRVRRPKYAKGGVSGWTWRLAHIDLDAVRAARPAPAGGTHASPRWHIRRGHFRTYPDGRRVFVRETQVGDPERGGVVKDYVVG